MLEDCLIESRRSRRTRKPLTLFVSVITHGSLVAALVLIPLFQEQLLPQVAMFEPLRPPEIHVRVTELVPTAHEAATAAAAPAPSELIAPIAIPKEIAHVVDAPIANTQGFNIAGPGSNNSGFSLVNLIGPEIGTRVPTPPPPPPTPPPAPPKAPEPAPASTEPVRRSGGVVMANLIHQVMPVYPLLALKSRTPGTVVLEAVITREGTIDPARIRVLSGNVLLNQAAIDAVVQWRYKPTTLSGQTVEVLTTISVNFTLN